MIARRLALAGALLGLAACASGGVAPRGGGAAPDLPPMGAGSAAWRIPSTELGTQRLFRLRYDGPEGEVGLKLTLWLESADRYRLSANDVVGRSVWSLAIDGERGLWLDHRSDSYCRFGGVIDLGSVPLSPFSFSSLPTLLLGRLPVPPVAEPETVDGKGEYRGADGRRWSYEAPGGRLVAWTVWEEGEPEAWWNGRAEEVILSQRRGGVQLRWRETVRETLESLPAFPEIPSGYVAGCLPDDG